MRRSVAEGVAFAATVGLGETYFLAHAIRLSASRAQQGLVATAPLFVGSLGALLALWALSRARARRPIVAAACGAQAVVLAALSLGSWSGAMGAEALVVAVALYGVCGQAAGAAWSSWLGDLVPEGVRGRYFAGRNRWIYGTTFASLLAGGLLLEWLEPAGPADAAAGGRSAGFAALYGLAAVARAVSAALHVLTPEPPFGGLAPRARAVRYLFTRQGAAVGRLLFAAAGFYLAVYVASPYFAPYMLEELSFGYLEYTVASATIVALKVSVLPLHGRWIDRGRPRAVFLGCAVAIALVPLPFVVAAGLPLVVLAQGLSGAAWGGFEVAQFGLLLDRTSRRLRPHVFALQSALNGSAQFGGALLGAALLGGHAGLTIGGLFLASAVARGVLAGTLGLATRPVPLDRSLRRRGLLLRVVGLRPSGGLVVRALPASPIPDPDPDPEGARTPELRERD